MLASRHVAAAFEAPVVLEVVQKTSRGYIALCLLLLLYRTGMIGGAKTYLLYERTLSCIGQVCWTTPGLSRPCFQLCFHAFSYDLLVFFILFSMF